MQSMPELRGNRICEFLLMVLLCGQFARNLIGQAPPDETAQTYSSIESLGLDAPDAAQLRQSMERHDYLGAEKQLLAEIAAHPEPQQKASLLAFIGSVYFSNQDYLNAAIAWKKADALKPLAPTLQFSLAMAYVRMGHSEWARPVLSSLASQDTRNALYPYWLGRLDYDGHKYSDAIGNFQHAIELAPRMARAYDNLGLCYFYENQNELAIASHRKAIELDRNSPNPSPWPYLNLAIVQQFVNQLPGAESNLRESIRLDAKIAQAHFQLGTVLEDENRLEDATTELQKAADLNANYAEPHMALARIYHKLGEETKARREVEIYRHLHDASAAPPQKTP
jgi:Flp pilus assembly protein TadD